MTKKVQRVAKDVVMVAEAEGERTINKTTISNTITMAATITRLPTAVALIRSARHQTSSPSNLSSYYLWPVNILAHACLMALVVSPWAEGSSNHYWQGCV